MPLHVLASPAPCPYWHLPLVALDTFGAGQLELSVQLPHAVEGAHHVRDELRVLVQPLRALLPLLQLSQELPLLGAQNALLKAEEASFVHFAIVRVRLDIEPVFRVGVARPQVLA